ncbi:MAG: hypothetical protein H6712_10570 [Myxococcales bacterium]|nr:hypothetical protein [Myxococcales bacterium]MCB9714292.1 hypothetical protein [Myxococcales bacterium]
MTREIGRRWIGVALLPLGLGLACRGTTPSPADGGETPSPLALGPEAPAAESSAASPDVGTPPGADADGPEPAAAGLVPGESDDEGEEDDPRGFTPVDIDSVAHVEEVTLPATGRAALGIDTLGLDDVYWAERRDDRLVIDTMYFDEAELEAMVEPVAAAERDDRPPPPPQARPPGLVTFRPGESMQVIAPGERVTWALRAFSVELGASNGYLLAYFGKESRRVPEALVLRTKEAHPGAVLRAPRTTPADAALLAVVRGWVGADPVATRLDASQVRRAPIGAPGGEGQLVAVSVLLDVENPEDDYPGHWSALVVLDPEGGTYPVVRPQRRGHELQPAYLVDLDGDGIDAIVFRSDDVHSGYTYLAVWDGSAYRNLRLTGSGG